MVGECVDIRLLDPAECVRVINEHRDLIVGVKVRVGRVASGANGVAPLDMAVEVAEETGLPVMAHLDHPPIVPLRGPQTNRPESRRTGSRADPRGRRPTGEPTHPGATHPGADRLRWSADRAAHSRGVETEGR